MIALPLLSLALAQVPAPGARDEGVGPRCEWSEPFRRLASPAFGPEARLVGPRRVKGRVRWPKPRQRHEIAGRWVAQVAIDARGRTVDARMVERPRVTPPWPEFEDAVLKDVRKIRWQPATADGVPVPVCMDLPVFSTPPRLDVPD